MTCDNCIHTNVCKYFPIEIAKCSDFEEKRTHGEWYPVAELDTTNDFAEWIDVNGDGSLWKCSRCGETSCCRGKYCCECGARMKEGGEK